MCCHKLVTDASKILQMTFDEVQHGPGNDYTYHHKIKKFFYETSLDPFTAEKRT